MKKIPLHAMFVLVAALAPIHAFADGATDFVIDPVAGYVISTPGNYRLAGDVVMTTVTTAIKIQVPGVSVDLNGHTINGGGLAPFGIDAGSNAEVQVSNGRVRGCVGFGVDLGDGARVRDVSVVGCGSGIDAGADALIENCIARGNTRSTDLVYGIQIGDNGRIENCVANGNIGVGRNVIGITVGTGGAVNGCTANGNRAQTTGIATGIDVSYECHVSNCTVRGNTGGGSGSATGIRASQGSQVRHNTCTHNIGGGSGGEGVGIFVGTPDCLIEGNTCYDNRSGGGNANGTGISLNGSSRVAGNTCTGNGGSGNGTGAGIVVYGVGSTIERNVCAGNYGGAIITGILVNGTGNVIRENSTSGHSGSGINLTGLTNIAESNRLNETTGILGAIGNTLGSGTLANTVY